MPLKSKKDALEEYLVENSPVYEEFQADLAIEWQDILSSLQENEAAIEFVSFYLYDKKWTNKILYAALVLRPSMSAPQWVPLCEENVLEEILKS